MLYSVERTDKHVLTMRARISPGWEMQQLYLADVHFDSRYCNRKLFKGLLEQAQGNEAGIAIIGDFFDAMQGRSDRRSDKDELLEEYKGRNYLDRLVDDAADYLMPFRENLIFISRGNHETSVRRHLETDLIERLCRALNTQAMGYAGFVRFLFERDGDKSPGGRTSRNLYFHHGSGGGGEVGKGATRAQREAATVSDAHIYLGGHIHQSWRIEQVRLRLSAQGKVFQEHTLHACLPTLKDEYDMDGGYHIESGRSPRPLGGYWLKFWYNRNQHGRLCFDLLKAQ